MKKLLTIILLTLLLTLTSCSEEEIKLEEDLLQVKVQKLSSLSSNSFEENFLAKVQSADEIELRSEISGKIIKVNKQLGDSVKEGDILASLGDDQNTNSIDIQEQSARNNLQNLQNSLRNTSNLYGSNIARLNDSLIQSLNLLYSTKLSATSTVSIYENQVKDSENSYNKAKTDKDTFVATKDLEKKSAELKLKQIEQGVVVATNDFTDTQNLLINSEKKLNDEILNALNKAYASIISANSYAKGVFGVTDITPQSDDFYKYFGISNDNLLRNTENALDVFDNKIDDLEANFELFKGAKIDKTTILNEFEETLEYSRNYMEDVYLLAAEYTIASGDFSQDDLNLLIKELSAILDDLNNNTLNIKNKEIELEDFETNKQSSLEDAENQLENANIAYETEKNSYEIFLQNQNQKEQSLDYALNLAEINLSNSKNNLAKIKVDNDIQVQNIENQIDDVKNQIKIEYNKQDLDYESIESQIDQAQSELDLIENQSSSKNIISDIDGVILEENINEGNIVNAGEILFVIGSPDNFKASFELDNDLAGQIKEDDKVSILCESCSKKNYTGKISKISKSLTETSNKVEIEILFKASKGEMKSNMFVEINLNIENDKISVPLSLLKNENDKYFVFIYEDGIAVKKEVITGEVQDDKIEILEGIDEDDFVITEGAYFIEDGQKVEMKKVKRG